MAQAKKIDSDLGIEKAPTGIPGFDEITNGGLPEGRPTLVCGGPGCGKTLFGITFLVRGALDYGQPGALITFEETEIELTKNVVSLGFDLNKLVAQKKLAIDHIHIDRNELQEMGDFSLAGLFVRIGYAIDSVKAKRVVLDTLESLFSGISNESILRAELRRLFSWLKDKGVTAVITAERGVDTMTRFGLEEYVSDCVILLENRVDSKIATRLLRVVKYRGSSHGFNEYPFLISEQGISVLPITSLGLDYEISKEYITSGITGLDKLLASKGFFRGSSILISGTAGTGKTSMVAQAIAAACARGESCIYFAFEEAASQIVRNMQSIGIDLEHFIKGGLLHFSALRPSTRGLEMHLNAIHRLTEEIKPSVVVIDPVTNLGSIASISEIKSMLTRLIDYFKMNHITAFFTSLTGGGQHEEHRK
jgi:circadian clock protein KaiC